MHGPDGVNYKNRIVYVEIVQSERIVHGHSGGDGDQADVHFETSVTFIDPGNGNTELRLRLRFDSDKARDHVRRIAAMAPGVMRMGISPVAPALGRRRSVLRQSFRPASADRQTHRW